MSEIRFGLMVPYVLIQPLISMLKTSVKLRRGFAGLAGKLGGADAAGDGLANAYADLVQQLERAQQALGGDPAAGVVAEEMAQADADAARAGPVWPALTRTDLLDLAEMAAKIGTQYANRVVKDKAQAWAALATRTHTAALVAPEPTFSREDLALMAGALRIIARDYSESAGVGLSTGHGERLGDLADRIGAMVGPE